MRNGVMLAVAAAFALGGGAMAGSHDHAASRGHPGGGITVSSEVPFDTLMDQAMHRMHADMAAAQATGHPDRDFLRMMIPHHQGAIDMAKIILLYGKDPRVRNLAQGIIAEQETEIRLMQSLLDSGTGAKSESSGHQHGTKSKGGRQ